MKNSERHFQIGEMAQCCGVSADTIRYYEKKGILEKPLRSAAGYRLYEERMVARLDFIKKAQGLGLTLSEIQRIIQCSKEGLKPCCDLVKKVFTEKIAHYESQIHEMTKMKKQLELLLGKWLKPKEARKRSFAVCPQIERTIHKRG